MILDRLSELTQRIVDRLFREWRRLFERIRNRTVPTFLPAVVSHVMMARRFRFIDRAFLDHIRNVSPEHPALIRQQAERVLAHCFDLLGSGPVVVRYGMTCRGLEGRMFDPVPAPLMDREGRWLVGRLNSANLPEARRIWALVDHSYHAIDWQLDFKSGYRWDERCWFRSIRFGHLPGVDIKVPWELARMQHLPVLALAARYAADRERGFHSQERYAREVRNQILDFIATNPPGFGVNWACPMDVGIRLTNMLVASDVLQAAGQAFEPDVTDVFAASIRAHGRHIAANLEWTPRFRGNHYLANIVGLLFAAVYLPRDAETDLWLVFATEELLAEIGCQFHEDGSNFEASVCYHRLSAEIVLWGLALLDDLSAEKRKALDQTLNWPGRLPERRLAGPLPLYPVPASSRLGPVPPWCRERIARMAAFTRAMTRPDGLVVQFGDNDSGRFLVLGSSEQIRAQADPAHPAWSLDHSGLLAAVDAFLGGATQDVGALLIAGLAGRIVSSSPKSSASLRSTRQYGNEPTLAELRHLWGQCLPKSRWRCEYPASPGVLADLETLVFAGMGCYILRGPRVYLAIRCGEIGLNGLGAHAHCDQLAIELTVDGVDRVRDPGSYIYTALPSRRNDYRSVTAHHAPRSHDREPANLHLGPFDLRGASAGECLYFGASGFAGRHAGYGDWVYRLVALEENKIVVLDFSPSGLVLSDPTPRPLPFSHGYGVVTL